MSVLYSVDIGLDIRYTKENIKYVLSKGADVGLIYFEDIIPVQSRTSLEKAADKILYTDSDSGERHIVAKFQDTEFFCWFFQSDDNIIIFSIGGFGYRWDRDFCSGSAYSPAIDFARYIRLMLEICNNFSVLELHTSSDITEGLQYSNNNCVTAVLDIGSFTVRYAGETEKIRESIDSMIRNAIQNDFVFFNDEACRIVMAESPRQTLYDALKAGFPVFLYAKVDTVPFKIEIKRTPNSYDFVSIYPLAPYKMKKGHASEKDKIDLAFYVQRMIELCENFAIYELKTF